MAKSLGCLCVVVKLHCLTEVQQEHILLCCFFFTDVKHYAMNYKLALSFIFQASRFAELTLIMNCVNWFTEVHICRQPDAFYYVCVNICINLSEVF